ncbi:MAG: DUF559 domain-containing protein [Acidimicrobiaceae bacterium]|nr:DUF559 domain-containing protein [Acidimicrobiaceae bacterium]
MPSAFSVPETPERPPAAFEDGLTDDNSPPEAEFVAVVQERVPHAVRWLTPQAPLDRLLAAGGDDGGPPRWLGDLHESQRRVDFLCSAPGAAPFVIEIDGQQHCDAQATDDLRDNALVAIGIETFRVPNRELRAESQQHEHLDQALDELRQLPMPPAKIDGLVWGAVQAHRLVLGLCEAMDAGWLDGDSWHIDVRDPTSTAAEIMAPYLELFDALDIMWNRGASAPRRVVFTCDDQTHLFVRISPGEFEKRPPHRPPLDAADVQIRLECDLTPSQPLPGDAPEPDSHRALVRCTCPACRRVPQHA